MINILKLEFSPKRIYGLDILRALAILFVVIGHGRRLLPANLDIIHNIIVFDGVSIFFVLSGFLIGGILIKMLHDKEPSKNLLFEFWIRRWFRTLPNYFLILTVLIILNLIFQKDISLWLIAKFFVFSQNLFYPHPQFFVEAWSLSVEEWFYLLIPLFIFLLIIFFKMPPERAVAYTAVMVLVLVTIFRLIRYINTDVNSIREWDLLFRKQVFTRLDSLMYGMIGAYTQFHYRKAWLKFSKSSLIAGLAIFAVIKTLSIFHLFPVGGLFHCVFSFSLTSLATLMLLPSLSNLKQGNGKVYIFFTYISLISYSMYLVNHTLVHSWIIGNIDFKHLTAFVYLNITIKYLSYWFFTLFLSILMYKFFEVPMMNLRENPRIKKILNTL